jgi:DNA repair protein RadC
MTSKIKQSAQIMDIAVFDHVIIGNTGKYFSFCDEGLI